MASADREMWRPGTRIVFEAAGGPSYAPLLQSLDLDDKMPLAMHDIAERILMAQGAGRTVKLIRINMRFFRQQVEGTAGKPNSIRLSRYWTRGGNSVRPHMRHRLFGVPVKWSKAKVPFYVVDNKGKKI